MSTSKKSRVVLPCGTREDTINSCIKYIQNPKKYGPRAESHLRKFASYWNLDFDQIVKEAKSEEKPVDSADDYLLVFNSRRALPVRNKQEFKAACEWFAENRSKLAFELRSKIACRLIEKAEKLHEDLGEFAECIEKSAGLAIPDPDRMYKAALNRAALAKNKKAKNSLQKLAKEIAQNPRDYLDPDLATDVVNILDRADRSLNMSLGLPEDVCFTYSLSQSKQATSDLVKLTTDSYYHKDDLKALKLADISDRLGEDFAEAVRKGLDVDVEKLAEEAEILPRKDAAILEELLEESGAKPVFKEKRSAALTFSDWKELAKLK